MAADRSPSSIVRFCLALALAARAAALAAQPADPAPAESEPDHSKVPGVVIDYSAPSTGEYVGSPSIARLPNGHYVIGNCHAGPGQPLLIEIDAKNKKVVWTFDRYDDFGNSVSNSILLDQPAGRLR